MPWTNGDRNGSQNFSVSRARSWPEANARTSTTAVTAIASQSRPALRGLSGFTFLIFTAVLHNSLVAVRLQNDGFDLALAVVFVRLITGPSR